MSHPEHLLFASYERMRVPVTADIMSGILIGRPGVVYPLSMAAAWVMVTGFKQRMSVKTCAWKIRVSIATPALF